MLDHWVNGGMDAEETIVNSTLFSDSVGSCEQLLAYFPSCSVSRSIARKRTKFDYTDVGFEFNRSLNRNARWILRGSSYW